MFQYYYRPLEEARSFCSTSANLLINHVTSSTLRVSLVFWEFVNTPHFRSRCSLESKILCWSCIHIHVRCYAQPLMTSEMGKHYAEIMPEVYIGYQTTEVSTWNQQQRSNILYNIFCCTLGHSFYPSFVHSLLFLSSHHNSFLRSFPLRSFVCSFNPCFLVSFFLSFVRSLLPFFVRSFHASFVRWFVRSFVPSFVPLFLSLFPPCLGL